MAKRFSKEELFTGPLPEKTVFEVCVCLQNKGDESLLVKEEVEASDYIIEVYGPRDYLTFFNRVPGGEREIRAIFREWLYFTEAK